MTGQDNPLRSALFTDLYELTMARAYAAVSMDETAVFELFFRRLPASRGFLLAAGLDDVLAYLESWRFTPGDIDHLAKLGLFPDDFLDRLSGLRFTGNVRAVPEGTAVFPGEPLLAVEAPIMQAQIVETLAINQIHFQTMAATKSARTVLAARGRAVVDFGSRRAHGTDAALKVARAAWLAGAAGTSNVLAGKLYGVPVSGTMAHSFVQAHASEYEAFRDFARLFPGTTLLVDTYDTLEGAAQVVRLARELGDDFRVGAIRIDSGDLAGLARACRDILDQAGLTKVRIFATSELDEYAVADLLDRGAPIDGFGVGTRLAVSADAPALDMVYKLTEYAGQGRAKLATGKVLHPGRKQVFRFFENGRMARDLVCRLDEEPGGEPLLREVMRNGERTGAGRETLAQCRERAAAQLNALPEFLRSLGGPIAPYRVEFSRALEADLERIRAEHRPNPSGPLSRP
ncbi:nicotinate phosphoribosyltransferase [Fundidesulfovibrio terrae]|uniref:nicotinate phosphoribosyltransferase n=1 Tax=Fundidesulfovibrio terrae TaxID=2922866 RepID=UPI001FAF80AF